MSLAQKALPWSKYDALHWRLVILCATKGPETNNESLNFKTSILLKIQMLLCYGSTETSQRSCVFFLFSVLVQLLQCIFSCLDITCWDFGGWKIARKRGSGVVDRQHATRPLCAAEISRTVICSFSFLILYLFLSSYDSQRTNEELVTWKKLLHSVLDALRVVGTQHLSQNKRKAIELWPAF